jgi:hypothetical protein
LDFRDGAMHCDPVPVNIVAASRVIDGSGDLEETERIVGAAQRAGLRMIDLHVAPMSMAWDRPIPEHYVRGACAPIEAMVHARKVFSEGAADLVVIRGQDNLRSEYADRKPERDRLMEVYGPGETFLKAYTQLGFAFLERANISVESFKRCAERLFENYWRTWKALRPGAERPHPRWFAEVSPLFRGVDCANPSVDFSGCLILASERGTQLCAPDPSRLIRVRAAQVEQVGEDGLASIDRIADFFHLETVLERASRSAQLDLRRAVVEERMLLEIYTCYPVVPIAFLLRSGLVGSVGEIPAFLERNDITISGGLNLAKAPWNNTTLSALIQMVHKLRVLPTARGLVHSVAALGYKQAVAVLARE